MIFFLNNAKNNIQNRKSCLYKICEARDKQDPCIDCTENIKRVVIRYKKSHKKAASPF